MTKKPKVVVMGLGYIGLPTAALIASKGISVTGVDVHQNVIDTINRGEIHIVEPDLDGLVHHVVKEGYLKASKQPVRADVYLIAVPTPFKDEHVPDLSYVEAAVTKLLPTLAPNALVIVESTSPVGTTQKVYDIIVSARPELKGKIHTAYCPERVLPGNIIYELEHNDRAIGGLDYTSTKKAVAFYQHFVKGDLHETNARTAEMCKLVENSSRDVQIAFANELSMICDRAEIDVWELIALANRHPRVNILQPGTGVGGHCIAVDPWFIVSEFPEESKIIRSARTINNYKTLWVIEKIINETLRYSQEYGEEPIVACMGLAFKPNIDDLRESPALTVADALRDKGISTLRVEPNLKQEDLTPYQEAVDKANIIVYLVAHKDFYSIRTDKQVLDFCGISKN
ncbi:MAG: UDP-N-acetyl-D-mannosamine dehydrogenase [Flavobacteriaceae bacterium]|nr:UDP-N-acetyl-D-mannosamine dehydrogenase [Flavobacteriaceae bacterium]